MTQIGKPAVDFSTVNFGGDGRGNTAVDNARNDGYDPTLGRADETIQKAVDAFVGGAAELAGIATGSVEGLLLTPHTAARLAAHPDQLTEALKKTMSDPSVAMSLAAGLLPAALLSLLSLPVLATVAATIVMMHSEQGQEMLQKIMVTGDKTTSDILQKYAAAKAGDTDAV